MHLHCSKVVLGDSGGEPATTTLTGLEFHVPNEQLTAARQAFDVQLSFLAFAETACAPLSLVTGPELEVYTADERTEDEIFELLVGDDLYHDGQRLGVAQFESTTSILLQVGGIHDGNKRAGSLPNGTDQLLIYAATSHPAAAKLGGARSGMITPPRSSSPALPSATPSTNNMIKIYALPLSSEASLHNRLSSLSPPPSPKSSHTSAPACYFIEHIPLPPPTPSLQPLPPSEDHPEAPLRKRPRLDAVFSNITTTTKPRSKGGRGVSKLMAALDRPRSASALTAQAPFSPGPPTPHTAPLAARPPPGPADDARQSPTLVRNPSKSASSSRGALSRSHTNGQIAGEPNASTAGPSTSALLHRRTGSLHRVASLASVPGPRPPSSAGGSARGSPAPLDTSGPQTRDGSVGLEGAALGGATGGAMVGAAGGPPGGTVSIEAQNKNALSRCVMAALRLWGHAQVKTSRQSRAVSAGGVESQGAAGAVGPAGPVEEDHARRTNDRYKLLYHNTLRTAAFALRRRAAEHILPQEQVRDVVERVLELFCAEDGGGSLDRQPVELK